MPAIGVMLWMASPSRVTGPVGQAVTGSALRIRSALTVSGAEPATSRRRPGDQPAIRSATTAVSSGPVRPSRGGNVAVASA